VSLTTYIFTFKVPPCVHRAATHRAATHHATTPPPTEVEGRIVDYLLTQHRRGSDSIRDDQTKHSDEVQDDKIEEFFSRKRHDLRIFVTVEKSKKVKRVGSPTESDDFVSPKRALGKSWIKSNFTKEEE
ncbi:hypothetical protein V2J09_006193, partial [Rumex salicifolius]